MEMYLLCGREVLLMDAKISREEFILKAIKRLRKPPYKGIHTVYSGFNQAFREYFGTDPIPVTQKMEKEKKIIIRPVKGGVMLYLPEDIKSQQQDPGQVIKKILE
jgi:hypothetical protein